MASSAELGHSSRCQAQELVQKVNNVVESSKVPVSLSMPALNNEQKSELPSEGDHRKRRRNRTTQSCLNCHATKRMCDRKRPCSRCSQLGLTGNCVYEVDGPASKGKPDEGRLKGRIAELEGVIRELKNKPHPRWLAEQDRTPSDSSGSPSSPLLGGSTPPIVLPEWDFASSPLYQAPELSPSLQPPPFLSHNNDPFDTLLTMYSGLAEHMSCRNRGGTCGCLTEAGCYGVVLDLSLRLRQAVEVLSRSPGHSSNSACALHTRILEVDTLVKNLLIGAPSCSGSSGMSSPGLSPDVFDRYSPQNDPNFCWDLGVADNDWMSWVPARSM